MQTKNVVMTWASGEAFCRSEGFACYVNSLKNIKEADFLVFSHDMPEDVRRTLTDRGVVVVDVEPARIKFLLRDRHLIFHEFLSKTRSKYETCVITDSKDVVFQRDPFEYGQAYWFDYALLAAEGMRHVESGWNMIDQYEAQQGVSLDFVAEYREWPVVNGGVFMGTVNPIKSLLMMIWSNGVRTNGRCTDQGVLNYLWSHLQRDETYFLKEPQRHLFCVTGEAVKEGFFKPVFQNNMFYIPAINGEPYEPYYIVHQWDRTEHKEQILAQYLKYDKVPTRKGA